jgi:SAM-dependent methyltransferase
MIVDAVSPEYRALLRHLFLRGKLSGRSLFKILDLGCGSLSLPRLLNQLNISFDAYLGIDLVITPPELETASMLNLKLREVDLLAGTLQLCHQFDLLVGINLLSYIENVDDVLANVRTAHTPQAFFLIIEPYPSLFWETWFDGVLVHLRDGPTLDRAFARNGWRLSETTDLRMLIGHAVTLPMAGARLYHRH